MKISVITALALLALGTDALAQSDPRIVEHAYNQDTVYELLITQGHASVVQLEQGEIVESIVVGDAEGWLVEPTSSADRVVVKPLTGARRTNMTVLTTKRSYAFTLDAYGGPDMFVVRFRYSQPSANDAQSASASYRFRGDSNLRPRLVSDNGATTSIFWDAGAPFPAIFVLDESKEEIPASYRAAGDGLVVDGIHDQIIFRLGDDTAKVLRREASR